MYPVDFDGARWIQTPDPGPIGWFRYEMDVPVPPAHAVLWVAADQDMAAYINGAHVAGATDARAGGTPMVHAFDVTNHLGGGATVLGFQVLNHDARPAALLARLVLVDARGTSVIATGSSGWRATSDVQRVRKRLSAGLPSFTDPTFDAGTWGAAQTTGARRDSLLFRMPPALVDAPLRASVITAPAPAAEMIAATSITLPGAPQDGWIRVGGTGPYTLFLNGAAIATSAAYASPGPNVRATPIRLFNIGPRMVRGRNVIAVHLMAQAVAALYLDGVIETGGAPITLATSPRWGVATPPFDATAVGTVPAGAAASAGPASSIWPSGTVELTVPARLGLTPDFTQAAIALAVLMAWLLAAVLVRAAGRLAWPVALQATALAHLPFTALLAVLNEASSLANLTPPGLRVAPVAAGVLAGAALTDAAAVLWLGPIGRRVEQLQAARAASPAVWAAAVERATTTGPPGRVRRLAQFGRGRAHIFAVLGIAAALGALLSFRLAYEPLWQDEATSVAVADGIRSHVLPILPSGVLYFKGEAYHYLLAAVGAIAGDGPVPMRAVSVLWFVLTVLAFGLVLLPAVFPHRPALRVALTAIFATAPAELAWAREIRMYQMAQFFAVLFVALFVRALLKPRTRWVALAMAALVAMYFSHEETFIFLPAVLVVFLLSQRLQWIGNGRWWVFGGAATVLIAAQYTLANLAKVHYLGIDLSNRPYVQLDFSDPWLYLRNVYFAGGRPGALSLVSSLAVLAFVVGIVRRVPVRIWLSAFVWVSVVVLSVLFSAKSGRYTFVTLPFLMVLAGEGALDLLGLVRGALQRAGPTGRERMLGAAVAGLAVVLGFAWIGLSLTSGPRAYGLAVSRLTGTPYAHIHPDYTSLITYLDGHEQPGDVVIALAPSIIEQYYSGRAPQYTLSRGPAKLLYLMERNGQIVDTDFGNPVLFSSRDLMTVVAVHHRVWLFAPATLRGLLLDVRTTVVERFDPMKQNDAGTLYLCTG